MFVGLPIGGVEASQVPVVDELLRQLAALGDERFTQPLFVRFRGCVTMRADKTGAAMTGVKR